MSKTSASSKASAEDDEAGWSNEEPAPGERERAKAAAAATAAGSFLGGWTIESEMSESSGESESGCFRLFLVLF